MATIRSERPDTRGIAWTDALDACCGAALNVELLSYGQAAERFGLSKSALIGRAQRQGYAPKRGSPIGKSQAPKPLAAPAALERPTVEPAPIVAPITVFKQLPSRGCAYPIGDPRAPDFHFCDAPSLPGKPYCAAHYHRCYHAVRDAA